VSHVYFWPGSLNFPYDEDLVGAKADSDFWREVFGCQLCRTEFARIYRQEYPEIESEIFWGAVNLYIKKSHPTIRHIAGYLKAEVVLLAGRCGQKEQENFDKEFFRTICHLLICEKCAKRYSVVAERMAQENSKVASILNPF